MARVADDTDRLNGTNAKPCRDMTLLAIDYRGGSFLGVVRKGFVLFVSAIVLGTSTSCGGTNVAGLAELSSGHSVIIPNRASDSVMALALLIT